MALKAGGKGFCKVVHTENGRNVTRRIHTMMVQTHDGKVHHLTGKKLPDSISLYTGAPYSGAHLAEVLLSPQGAKATPMKTESWFSQRDAFFVAIGMFVFKLVASLAEEAAYALM
ncbi:MAG: hypothetical protein AAF394_17385 [Planctomycetota bacterium]